VSPLDIPDGSDTETGQRSGESVITMADETLHQSNQPEDSVPRRLEGVDYIAKYVGLSVHTVYTMVSQRRIPFVKVGGRLTKFDLRAVDEWIKRHTVMPMPERD
jgi:excisionase family DNA binding protein